MSEITSEELSTLMAFMNHEPVTRLAIINCAHRGFMAVSENDLWCLSGSGARAVGAVMTANAHGIYCR